jgi:hypothetical protein
MALDAFSGHAPKEKEKEKEKEKGGSGGGRAAKLFDTVKRPFGGGKRGRSAERSAASPAKRMRAHAPEVIEVDSEGEVVGAQRPTGGRRDSSSVQKSKDGAEARTRGVASPAEIVKPFKIEPFKLAYVSYFVCHARC